MIARDSDASKKFYRTVINLNGMWGTSGMITIDSDASKSFYRTVIKTEQSKGKTWLTAASQYFGESTRVLSGQYSSTLGAVLEYFRRSTAVLWAKYSNSLPGSVSFPYSPHFTIGKE